MNTNSLVFFVRDEQGIIEHDECGDPIVGVASYVVAEADDGRRWAHFYSFPHQRVEHIPDEEGCLQVCITPRDIDSAVSRLMARLVEAEELNMDYWNPVDPRYGSQAYLYVEQFLVERERQEAEAMR